MRFSLKTLISLTAFIGLLMALYLSHAQTKAVNLEAADLAAKLYRQHLFRAKELDEPYGSLLAPSWTAIAAGQGDILDLRSAAGRRDLISRIEAGKTDFRVRCANGKIMKLSDLHIWPDSIISWESERAFQGLTSKSLSVPSDNKGRHRSSGGSSSLPESPPAKSR